jgi:hypothetical protein
MGESVIDSVMTEIMKGCKAKVQREHRVELKQLRADSKKLQETHKELNALKKQLTTKRDKAKNALLLERKVLSAEREAVQRGAAIVLRGINSLNRIKKLKLVSFISTTNSHWQACNRDAAALRKVRAMTCPKKPVAKRSGTKRG